MNPPVKPRRLLLPAVLGLLVAGPLHPQQDSAGRDSLHHRAESLRPDSTYTGPTTPVRALRPCRVTRVVDGDTLVCSDVGRVRLIGMDSPERNHPPFGVQSRAALLELVPVGTTVSLEPDLEPRDRYGRMLAYVWRNGKLVNWLLVRQGWAVMITYPPNVQYADQLREAQQLAREAGLGLWGTGGFECLPAERRAGRC